VRELLANEADANLPGHMGSYPLHDLAHAPSGRAEIAHMLLGAGALVEVFDPTSYQTPLMWAAAGKGGYIYVYINPCIY
jgi:ankyrin repeat protein